MELFKVSRLKFSNIYSLPTPLGLLMFIIITSALWFSYTNNSEVERWFALIMIIFILVHLAETSYTFRFMDIRLNESDPPFAQKSHLFQLQLTNNSIADSDNLEFKIKHAKQWLKIDQIQQQSFKNISIPFTYPQPGLHELPSISLRFRPLTHLFIFWKVLNEKKVIKVLPPPHNHHVTYSKKQMSETENELKDLIPIRDPRLFYKADAKLLIKTEQHYLRHYAGTDIQQIINLDWDLLKPLTEIQQREQFSFWIDTLENNPEPNSSIRITTPFYNSELGQINVDWSSLKHSYANWLYE